MNNREVCEYVKGLDAQKNDMGKEYIAEKCVSEGYGQTCGGYLKGKNINAFSQKEHFLSYYGSEKKKDKLPSYSYLRCPQLLLFIAEIAGMPKEKLEEAYNIIIKYFQDNINHVYGFLKNVSIVTFSPV